jgi:Fe2+ or Zn2+ uptake regulation protein
VEPEAAAPVRPRESKYVEDIAAILQGAEHRLTFQPIYEAVQARGHRCSKKTVQRYLKKMLRSGRLDHDSRGYGLTANLSPWRLSRTPNW